MSVAKDDKDGHGLGEGTLAILGWGCAAGTLEPLAYTRASSSEFWYPILDLTLQIPPYPKVAVFQKLLRSLARSIQNRTNFIFLILYCVRVIALNSHFISELT